MEAEPESRSSICCSFSPSENRELVKNLALYINPTAPLYMRKTERTRKEQIRTTRQRLLLEIGCTWLASLSHPKYLIFLSSQVAQMMGFLRCRRSQTRRFPIFRGKSASVDGKREWFLSRNRESAKGFGKREHVPIFVGETGKGFQKLMKRRPCFHFSGSVLHVYFRKAARLSAQTQTRAETSSPEPPKKKHELYLPIQVFWPIARGARPVLTPYFDSSAQTKIWGGF